MTLKFDKFCFVIELHPYNFKLSIDLVSLIIIPISILLKAFTAYVITAATIMLHELCHIAVAAFCRKRIGSVKIFAIGLNASVDDIIFRQWSSIAVFSAGPFINLLIYSLGSILNSYYLIQSDSMRFFISMNLYLGVFNLLPVLPLDGGKILREVLAKWIGTRLGNKYSKGVSIFFLSLIMIFGIIQFIDSFYNLSLILIGIYLIYATRAEGMEAAIMSIKNIIYRQSRFLKKGVYEARNLVVTKSMSMNESIKFMDFDRFHIIHVLDENLHIIGVLTEQQVIDGLLKYDNDLTFGEFMQRENINNNDTDNKP